MDEIWERAVETALEGQTDTASVRNLTLDGAVKCIHGRLPSPSLFEKFHNLQHLSIANIGVSTLEQFPCLRSLQKLILSDNRIAGGLEFLVEAGLDALRDLDLSNNRIQDINDLRPLAELKLVSLDLYECPVTRVGDYRSRVFGLIKSLRYLDKMDADENERPESDEEDEDEEEDEDDPGSGEVDGEDRPYRLSNGHSAGNEGIVDVDEDEESDADEEEMETSRGVNGSNRGLSHHQSNGFRVVAVHDEDDEEDDGEGEDEEDNESVEEIDEEEGDDEDVVEVHEIEDSDDEEDGVEDDDEDEDEDDDEEEVDNDEQDLGKPESTGRSMSTEGEIDGHEQGEDDGDEDDIGETGEEEQGIEEDGEFEDEEDAEDEEEDNGTGYLVQPVGGQVVMEDAGGSDVDPGNEEDEDEIEEVELEEEIDDDDEEDDDHDGEIQELPPPSSSNKRKRDRDEDEEANDEEDDDDAGLNRSSKHR